MAQLHSFVTDGVTPWLWCDRSEKAIETEHWHLRMTFSENLIIYYPTDLHCAAQFIHPCCAYICCLAKDEMCLRADCQSVNSCANLPARVRWKSEAPLWQTSCRTPFCRVLWWNGDAADGFCRSSSSLHNLRQSPEGCCTSSTCLMQ